MSLNLEGLSELSMWEDWQEIVRRSGDKFCASPIYVQQRSQRHEDFERTAEYVVRQGMIDLTGMTRDAEFGGLVRETKACGPVTRMWLDSNVEIDFLFRQFAELRRKHGTSLLSSKNVLDIGAGYGRLAVSMMPVVASYTCIDPVPISTEICTKYCGRFAPSVRVMPLPEFCEKAVDSMAFSLAINVHSWNECTFSQVARWVAVLVQLRVAYLFTVSNGSMLAGGKEAYATWGGQGESFRPILEHYYDLIAEEHIGLSYHPHALWRMKP